MARIRRIEIDNFRCIESLDWFPSDGVNCLIGAGDAGKSSVLDAIDLCLGARRVAQFTDADFNRLKITSPIRIAITIGDLSESLKSIETYGAFVRGFDPATNSIDYEPETGRETVLTVLLSVGSDLDPVWTLISDRAGQQGLSRNLTWGDRVRLSPTRIGALADHNLAWRRGSVLNKISDEKPQTTAALAEAAREARRAFGDMADDQLAETLESVATTAAELGIDVGAKLKAMLDAHSVSFSTGAIALHGEDGVPLKALGVGSTRLLVAGLQRKAADEAGVVLVDELEHGLEPHRIIRFLGAIGAKEETPPVQAFLTTHSPTALRELSGDQLWILRKRRKAHRLDRVGQKGAVQGKIRTHPEALLARSVLVCEGASEVGLMRGLDLYFASEGQVSLNAHGVALVDAGGLPKIYGRAQPFVDLGYRTAVLRDDDVSPSKDDEGMFEALDGTVFKWRDGRALEEALFLGVSATGFSGLLDRATALHGEELVASHIQSASKGRITLRDCRRDPSEDTRLTCAAAAKSKRNAWFKSVTFMEEVSREVVGPDLARAHAGFRRRIATIFAWCGGA